MADQDRGRGTGDPEHVVVFGKPVALVAPAFRVLCEVLRIGKRLTDGVALWNGG